MAINFFFRSSSNTILDHGQHSEESQQEGGYWITDLVLKQMQDRLNKGDESLNIKDLIPVFHQTLEQKAKAARLIVYTIQNYVVKYPVGELQRDSMLNSMKRLQTGDFDELCSTASHIYSQKNIGPSISKAITIFFEGKFRQNSLKQVWEALNSILGVKAVVTISFSYIEPLLS